MNNVVKFFGRPQFEALRPIEVLARGSTAQIYVLIAEFTVVVPDVGTITVPKGFETDFASIPGFALGWLDDDDPIILYASIVHDYLYSVGGLFDLMKPALTRQQCDDVLRVVMIACEASVWRAWCVYKAVRMFGAGHFEAARRAPEAEAA